MSKRSGDWWCPTCKFTIWGSKDRCAKCGYLKPSPPAPSYWTPGDEDPRWNSLGPYSILKGGYYGDALPDEPLGLIYPKCGCNHKEDCPKRHHLSDCRCYTCRFKPHKW